MKDLNHNTMKQAPDLGRLEEELRIERKWRETAVNYGRSLEAILANLDRGILVLDAMNRVLYSNQALANMFGLSTERISRMTRDQVFREVAELCEDPEFLEKTKLVGNTASPVREEFEIHIPKWSRIGCVSKPITLPSGGCQLVVFTNITADVDQAADRERLALVDGLTGLANRRAADAAVAREAALADRTDRPLSFALFDIDFFKKINDTYGHEGGDRVLQEVGRLMIRLQRKGDIIARWGGEEFLTILVNVDLAGAHIHAERFRKEVAALVIEGLGPLTISAGVSEYRKGESPGSALKRADEKLYEAKTSGRNRVCY
jgi:diguanylate cyclase (GGDEF)-like protein